MGKSLSGTAFIRVVDALNQIANEIIKWPENLAEEARHFERNRYFPHCVGAIHGTFIVIKALKDNSDAYVTRKYNHAMTLQATSKRDIMFTDDYIAFPGSVHDARVFRNSTLCHAVLQNLHRYFRKNLHIIAGKARTLGCSPTKSCLIEGLTV